MEVFFAILSFVTSDTSFAVKDLIVNFTGTGNCTILKDITQKWPENIVEANFEDGITDVGEYYFSYHYSLIRVGLSKTTKIIRKSSFYKCTNLSEISFPSSLQEIHGISFSSARSIKYLNYTGEKLIIGPNAFHDCPGLKSISIISNFIYIDIAPLYAPNVESITIKSLNTTFCETSFWHMPKLKFVDISGLDVVNKTHNAMNLIFRDTIAIEEMYFESQKMNITKEMLEPFTELKICSLRSQSLNVTEFNLSKLLELTLFSSLPYSLSAGFIIRCTSLQHISILGSIQLIPERGIYNCNSLRSAYIESIAEVTTLGHNSIFSCNSIQSIDIKSKKLIILDFAMYSLYGLEYINISSNIIDAQGLMVKNTAVKWIEYRGKILLHGMSPFETNDNLRNISFISSLSDSIEIYGCLHERYLENLYIEAGNITFRSGFHGTDSLNYLKLKCCTVYFLSPFRNFQIERIEIDGVVDLCKEAFKNLALLKSFVLNNNNLSSKGSNIRVGSFANLTLLNNVVLDGNQIHIWSDAFYNCSALREIKGKGTKLIGNPFNKCTSLEKIEFTKGKVIEFVMEYKSDNRIKILILEAREINILEINEVFMHYEEIRLIGDMVRIQNSFRDLNTLKRVYLNFSRIFIDYNIDIFNNCSNLRYLHVNGIEYNDVLDYSTLDELFYEGLKKCGFSKILNVNKTSVKEEFSFYRNLEFISFTSSNISEMHNCFKGSPNLHTIFFSAFQPIPLIGVLEIPPTVLSASYIVRGSKIRELIITESYDYRCVVYECETLETLRIKSINSPVDHLVERTMNLRWILFPLEINFYVRHLTHFASAQAEVYYCGSENIYTKQSDILSFHPRAVFVTKLYKADIFGYTNVTKISIDTCLKMIQKVDNIRSFCEIKGKTQAMELLPIFLLISSSI